MTIKINAQGAERKRLVQIIAQWLGCDAKYLGVPSCAYRVDYFTIEKDGSLTFDDSADSEVVERLMQHLYDEGFDIDQSQPVEEPEEAFKGICISMPRSLFTDGNLENLKALITAKGSLIKKALGVAELPIEVTDTKVSFPWFPGTPTPDELRAYDSFICKLCEMARNQKRVSTKEKEVDNEKYAFRCFLLRLGFIGNEYKAERKILLRNLTGSSAFRSGQRSEVESCE
ncbi:MAG: virulence protein [Oscillospiraceae bacterium]|nr:virulence protein [Oscillospiraceae bacterium]